MRNARIIGDLVITSDNSGAIGEKELDVVHVPDEVTSYFSTRVTLLEQLASYATPFELVLLNFTSEDAWANYIRGIEKIFQEVNLPCPAISGSTETNMPTLQSGFGLTMLGRINPTLMPDSLADELIWYSYGRPLVGEELLKNKEQVADISLIIKALNEKRITQVVPVGSKGVRSELEKIIEIDDKLFLEVPYDATFSAGPSTIVLISVTKQQEALIYTFFGDLLTRLK